MSPRNFSLSVAFYFFLCCTANAAQLNLQVKCERSGKDVPVRAAIDLPKDLSHVPLDEIRVEMEPPGYSGRALPGQIVKNPEGRTELWWILPEAKAGSKEKWSAQLGRGELNRKSTFTFQDTPGDHLDILFGGKPVARYMYAYDTSTKEKAHETYKVYTHVLDGDGKEPITKGSGGLYPHHRGIFIGWNRLGYDEKKRCDSWHMNGCTQVHQKFLEKTAGPILARWTALIHWNDRDGKPIIMEERTTTVFRQPEPTIALICHRSKLGAPRSDVRLDGDPEHAGCQYRPHNEVAENKSARYQFPDDKITTGNVRKAQDLPWAGLEYEVRGEKYSVTHLNHPENPKETAYSAYRDYGRFGAFPRAEIKKGDTLILRYHFWVVRGEMQPRERMQEAWWAFAERPGVEVLN